VNERFLPFFGIRPELHSRAIRLTTGGFLMNQRNFGLLGVLGAMILFIGDMLLYGHFGSAGEFNTGIQAVAREASSARLYIGGLVGPAGAMLYIAGFRHIYLNTKRSGRLLSWSIFICLTCMMLFGGAYHALWTVRMLLFKHPGPSAGGSNLFLASFDGYFKAVFSVSLSTGYIGGVLLACCILFFKTNYPRWTVLANPGILLLSTPLMRHIPYPIGAIAYGGCINLAFIVFFTVSAFAARKEENEAVPSA
jgi:hypothetical protein